MSGVFLWEKLHVRMWPEYTREHVATFASAPPPIAGAPHKLDRNVYYTLRVLCKAGLRSASVRAKRTSPGRSAPQTCSSTLRSGPR